MTYIKLLFTPSRRACQEKMTIYTKFFCKKTLAILLGRMYSICMLKAELKDKQKIEHARGVLGKGWEEHTKSSIMTGELLGISWEKGGWLVVYRIGKEAFEVFFGKDSTFMYHAENLDLKLAIETCHAALQSQINACQNFLDKNKNPCN